MCRKLFLLTSFVLVLALAGTNVALGEIFETVIADQANDTEEDLNPSKLGEADRGSSDLEFPSEDADMGDPQLVGLRFQVDIPAGKLITNAWIQFTCDKDDKLPAAAAPVNVIIEGELSPDAPEFHDDAPAVFDLSSRPTTTAKVKWSVPVWVKGDRGPDQTSTNIASIIQEIIDLPGWASGNSLVLIIRDDPDNPSEGMREAEDANPPAGDESALLHVEYEEAAAGATITVEAGGDIAAANAMAVAGDTIDIAAGTFVLTGQIEIKDGVTYQGAGAGLTIIDGGGTTRAFVAWGDRGATSGQVDADGVGVSNNTGPKDWVLDGLTIQNCVADTVDRRDILGAARDLLNNYTGSPYTLATAQGENDAFEDNPGWFDVLSGGADENLTDAELQAYLDGNPVGSAGHLVTGDDKSRDGGAVFCSNGAVGTIANCEFLNNSTPLDGDDGGAVNITGLSVVTVNDCLFDGNYACSPDGAKLSGPDGDAGHIKVQGGSASAITPGTTLIANRCVFLNGKAEDDGAAVQSSAVGSIIRLDACWFEANAAADDGTALLIGNESSGELTVTNCVFVNNISAAASDRMCQVRRNSKFINCTFVGNNQDDQDMIYNNANSADTDADGADDEMADATQVINCIFANNVVGGGDHVLGSRNASFTIAAVNCLFFGNTLQNGNPADNTQRPADETGSVLADPLLDANYVPGAGSPAIDAGVDVSAEGVTTDYNGNARPAGAAYDIGAHEAP